MQGNRCNALGGKKRFILVETNKKKTTLINNQRGKSLKLKDVVWLKKSLRHRHGWLQQNSRVVSAAGRHVQVWLLHAAPVQVSAHPVHGQSRD